MSKSDSGTVQNIRPIYYDPAGKYEPLKVIDAWNLGFRLGSALKYLARAGKKTSDPREDLIKARTYIDLEIKHQDKLRAEEAASART